MPSCPYCGLAAKTQRGLAKHLSGTAQYGGHDVPIEDAAQLAAGAAVAEPSAPTVPLAHDEADIPRGTASLPALSAAAELDYLTEVFSRLITYKAFPKYQFERRIDAFLSGFLPEVLERLLGGSVSDVVPEFPLKKPGTNMSTNVDHVLYQRNDAGPDRWLFFELKTDMASVSNSQLLTYSHYAGLGMRRLMQDVLQIQGASQHSVKYAKLLARFSDLDLDSPFTVVYLSPVRVSGVEQSDAFMSLTFEDMRSLDLARHSEVWALFKNIVLPALG